MSNNLLLDSHVVLWALVDQPRLSREIRHTMGLADQIFVSAATVWELAIKQRTRGLNLVEPLTQLVPQMGFKFLEITPDHAEATHRIRLPHKDPFDRLLVAQAQIEDLTFLTADQAILQSGYPFLLDARQ